jgi:hypothetical protein
MSIAAFVLLIFILLWLPPVHRAVKNAVVSELTKRTGSKMQIGRLKFIPFNRICLDDVYIEDLQGDTLLFAETVNARFNLLGFFRNQICINSVEIDDFTVNISRDRPDSNPNFMFIVEAFASEDSSSDSKVEFSIERLKLSRGSASYNVASVHHPKNGAFDASHICINDLNVSVNLYSVAPESLDIKLESMSFNEKCGFRFDDMRFVLKSDGQSIKLNGFELHLPDSEFSLPEAVFDFSGNYSLNIESSKTFAGDLFYFFPEIKQFTDTASFSISAEGRFPAIKVTSFKANYGENCSLSAIASVQDVIGMKKADATINIDRFLWNGYLYGDISAKADYNNDSLSVEIGSDDPNISLKILGKALLTGNKQNISLQADIDCLRPDVLRLTEGLPGSSISCFVSANINGLDPELMSAQITVDSMRLKTVNGLVEEPHAVISYNSLSGREKYLSVSSRYMDFDGKGVFSFYGAERSIYQAFHSIFSKVKQKHKKPELFNENLDLKIELHNANDIAVAVGAGIPPLPDSIFIYGKYEAVDSLANISAGAFFVSDEQDTASVKLNVSGAGKTIILKFNAESRSKDYVLACNFETAADLEWKRRQKLPDIVLNFAGGSIKLNDTEFGILPAQFEIRNRQYIIRNFAMENAGVQFLNIDGAVSENSTDSLLVGIGKIEIETLLKSLKYDIPLTGAISGDISFSRMMTAPRIVTRNFSIDSINFDRNLIGSLKVTSGWSAARSGFWFRATLSQDNNAQSIVSGIVSPERDSITVNGDINGLKLNWFADYLAENIYGLEGEAGMKFHSVGLISKPVFSGAVFLRNAKIGVRQTGVMYEINDSAALSTDKITFNEFSIADRYGQKLKINGNIKHSMFTDLKPELKVDMNNFTVLDNANQTDSLFFGLIRANGHLIVNLDNNNWLVAGLISNGKNNSLLFNIPETQIEARRYNMITFIGNEDTFDVNKFNFNLDQDKSESAVTNKYKPKIVNPEPKVSLPVKINLKLSLDNNLSIGVLLNPATNDIARATGTGQIEALCNLNDLSTTVRGNYIIDNGRCTLTLKNITRKTFTIQNGSKLTFRGDPMKTAFDVTAVYSLKAKPETLDATFAELTAYSKIPVNCQLTASGDLDRMRLDYRVVLPDEPDDIQNKLDNLLSDDNIKIKQIACLLAFGSFTPLTDGTGDAKGNSSIWTSLASAPVSAQLNNLLSGVLKDNWSIGTDLHSEDGGFSNVTMDINISTSLFNDRLTLNSAIGFKNNSAVQTDNQTNNLTGDFDLEYKLSPGGNVALRFFNLTNNKFSERAKTTQGAGIVYRRKGKTFRQLWRNFRTQRRN